MRGYISLFLLVVSLGFYSSASLAEDYYWSASGVEGKFSSALEGCQAKASSSYPNWRVGAGHGGGTRVYDCQRQSSNGNWSVSGFVQRFGDSCPGDHTYNGSDPTKPICIPPEPENPCEDKEGDSEPFSRSGSRNDGWYSTVKTGGKTYGVTPGEACLNGCAATLNQNCVYTISADKYICVGTAYFTGSACSAGDPAVDSDPLQRDVEPETNQDDEPCVYVQDGEGRMTCVSKSTLEEDGQNCGMAGPPGSEVRVCRPKEANKEEKKTETEIEEKPTPDGGTETVKKDVHTETKCHGSPDNCTTTTTTTTTTTKKDGSGTTTKTEVTCKGAKCGDDGKGGSGGGGGGGQGDDDIGTGDLPGNDDVPGFGEALGNFTSKVQGSPIVSSVAAISFPSGGACNMPSANVYLIGSVSFDWFCRNANILDPLYYVMLGIWALGAVRLFMEA